MILMRAIKDNKIKFIITKTVSAKQIQKKDIVFISKREVIYAGYVDIVPQDQYQEKQDLWE